VLATGRQADALASLGQELDDRFESLVADLADRDQVAALPARAGRVDVLVANAALPGSGRLESFAPEEIDRAIDVNLRAPVQLARALLPPMVERDRGHLVFISSLNGKLAAPGASVYTATKYGLRGFAASLRADLRGDGVGVSAVFPSFVADAGMWADTEIELPRGVSLPTPDDVAAGVVKAIERDRGEVDVAPVPLRAAAGLAGLAPGLVASLGQRLGSAEVADQAATAQRSKR
jgi:NADP-dependent 3-hydroxy acid dehydrogenase YdfG